MALTNNGKTVLQSKLSSYIKTITLFGAQWTYGMAIDSPNPDPLVVSSLPITWGVLDTNEDGQALAASDGISALGVYTFNMPTDEASGDPNIDQDLIQKKQVYGVVLQSGGGTVDNIRIDLTSAEQSVYTWDPDQVKGKYTISSLNINFS